MNKLIEIDSIWKIYYNGGKQTIAVKDVSLTLKEAEYLAIVGPSGAGKTTLLHIMSGLDSPTKGRVLFEGKDLYTLGDYQISLWRNMTVGFVFQFYHLIEELNVLENVALPSLAFKGTRKTSFKKAQKLLKYLNIEEKVKYVPSQLSGGERQKVAIARALVNEPRIIFCDEPTGNLDKDSADKVISLLEFLNKNEKKTLVIVTHNPEIVKKADRVINIRVGQVTNS